MPTTTSARPAAAPVICLAEERRRRAAIARTAARIAAAHPTVAYGGVTVAYAPPRNPFEAWAQWLALGGLLTLMLSGFLAALGGGGAACGAGFGTDDGGPDSAGGPRPAC